jgi:hypothetical protein
MPSDFRIPAFIDFYRAANVLDLLNEAGVMASCTAIIQPPPQRKGHDGHNGQ